MSRAASSDCVLGRRAAALAGQVPPMPLRICKPTCTVLSCMASLQQHNELCFLWHQRLEWHIIRHELAKLLMCTQGAARCKSSI